MDFITFHAAFDQLPNPAFLRVDGRWEGNPAAAVLAMGPEELLALCGEKRDRSIYLADSFYSLLVDPLEDGSLLLSLRPDRFAVDQASSISIQLRNSLGPALYAVENLEELESLRSDPAAKADLSRINQRLYRIFRLATQLDWCQNYNPLLAQEELVDLVKFLHRFTRENQHFCQSRSMPITFQSPLHHLTTVVATYSLSYLLLTLLSNSLGFAQSPGSITLTLTQQEGQAVITYQDTNRGVPATLLSQFLWNEPDRLIPGRGLGLGLPISQRIASSLHGTLVQTGSGDQGVGMVLSFPLRKGDPSSLHAPLVDRTGGYSMSRILLSNALDASLYSPEEDLTKE